MIAGAAENIKWDESYQFDNLPEVLRALPQFVCWRYEPDEKGKLTKVPYNPSTWKKASSTNPRSWRSFEDAVRAYRADPQFYNGISFAVTKAERIVGGDLDHCIDPVTREITDWALAIIARFKNTYWEISPSGEGLRFFLKGALPASGRKKGNVELYNDKHFLTLTGNRLEESSPLISAEYENELVAFHAEVFGTQQGKGQEQPKAGNGAANGHTNSLSDDELLILAKHSKNGARFAALHSGDISGYASQSEADLSLCSTLSFYCGPDALRIDHLFRQSGLYRKKWDEKHGECTYGEKTLQKALASTHAFYSGSNGNGHAAEEPPKTDWTESTQPEGHPPIDFFACTDLGNGERLIDRYGENLRYCNQWKQWLLWNAHWWEPDDTQKVRKWAKTTVRGIYEASKRCTDLAEKATEKDKKEQMAKRAAALVAHAVKSEASWRVDAMIREAQKDCPVLPDRLDVDPWLLNAINGTLDLRTGELRLHAREDLLTKGLNLTYESAASCPLWEAFLESTFAGNQELIAYMQRAAGYSLTGDTSEQCLFFLHGAGSNGKSTFLETLRAVLAVYGQQAEFSTFLHKDKDTVRNDLAKLRGARFVTAVEVEEGRRLAESVVKHLTGGDIVTARFLFAEYFDFRPSFKLWLAANHKPIIKGTDYAIWRRIHLIPFNVKFEGENKDGALGKKLRQELPGILAWMVRGCLFWQQEGLAPPEIVQAATAEYRKEMDVMGNFIAECCVEAPHLQIRAADLLNAFVLWSSDKSMTPHAFGKALADRGFTSKRSNGTWWLGLGLQAEYYGK